MRNEHEANEALYVTVTQRPSFHQPAPRRAKKPTPSMFARWVQRLLS